MTESEKHTEQYFKKFFLPQYTFGTVMILEGKQERELCDCLIETSNCYVVIQIKEKNENKDSSNDEENWFKNKILNIAKKQIKRTIRDLKKENATYYCDEGQITIDKTKEILPVIVFFNDYLTNYDKLYYSEELKSYINIFNKPDYKTMLDTIKVPMDIVGYLKCRSTFVPENGECRYILDDVAISLCENEEDFAEYYLKSTYYDHDISIEKIVLFNEILADLNKDFNNSRNSLIETLLMLNTPEIAQVTDLYAKTIQNINNPKIAKPKLLTNDKEGIMFIRRPRGMKDIEFNNFLSDMCTYYAYTAKLEKCNAIIFEPSGNEHFIIKGALCTHNYFENNKRFEKTSTEIDSILWGAEY